MKLKTIFHVILNANSIVQYVTQIKINTITNVNISVYQYCMRKTKL